MSGTIDRTALYAGWVTHRRLKPFKHAFHYRTYSILVDLDRLPDHARSSRLFSHNRPNLFSFYDRDHGPRDGTPLRPWVDGVLADHGQVLPGGTVQLLCFPRVLGYVFNPLSVYLCRDANGVIRTVLYEVRNTFGDMHTYLVPIERAGGDTAPMAHETAKGFYVSPFMDMDGGYRFRLRDPDDRLSLLIRQFDGAGDEILVAAQTGRKRSFNDRNLLALFASHPALTWKVISAIHWEALKLWRKGARYHPRQPVPDRDVSLASQAPK